MRGKKWFILLASLALVLLASSMGVTRSSLIDPEGSGGNAFQAWVSRQWLLTTQADFNNGVLTSTVEVQIGANNRDAWDDGSSGSLNECYFGDADWWDAGGYQWSLSIPRGAIIDVAYISVYPAWHGGATGAYTAGIRVEDVDNPAAFNGTPNDIRGRTYWTTTVDWAIPAGGLPIDQWNDSPSIKDLVQHAVDSPGWVEDNYISIAIWGQTGNGGCGEGVIDFSSDPSYTARLHIEYRTVDTATSPGNVLLAGQGTQDVVIAADDFESGGWSGGTGWLWGWWHEGFADITNTERPHGGNLHLRLRAANGYVDRAVDLSGQLNVHLQFWAKAKSFEPGEFAECLVSSDGINWTTVQTWVDGDDDNVYRFYDIDLSGFTMSSEFYIAFDSEMSGRQDYLYIDDLELVVTAAGYCTSGTIASQVLDTGIPGASWDALFWDEILPAGTDITFEVRASDTLSGGFPDAAWIPIGGTSPVTSGLPPGRYMQWRATLTTSDPSQTPILEEVRVYHY